MYKFRANTSSGYEMHPANGRRMPRDCIGSRQVSQQILVILRLY
jgi:hypothetical protein